MKTFFLPFFCALLALPVVTASAAMINYTDGSQVNLLNAWGASMSATGSTSGGTTETINDARFSNSLGFPANVRYSPSSNPALTMDFGTARTVKTLTSLAFDANTGYTTALVETSNDGTNWTTQSNTVTNPDSKNSVVTLNSAVSARYVRLTPQTFQDGSQVEFVTVRAFGTTGALAGDSNLSIMASPGLSASQSVTGVGSGAFGPTNFNGVNQILAPATEPATASVVQFMGNNMGFKLDLGQTFKVDRGALSVNNYHTNLGPVILTLYGSTDDSVYSTVDTITFNTDPTGFNLFNFTFDAGATDLRYLKYIFTTGDSTNNNIQVGDFELYQVPEPSTIALGALGVFALVIRLRRKQRSI